MELSGKTRVNTLLSEYPFLEDFLPAFNPAFSLLKKKSFRMTLGRVATLRQASSMAKVPLRDLLCAIRDEIKRRTGSDVPVSFGRYDDPEVRKKVLKEIIRDLHRGTDPEGAKRRFGEFLAEVDPSEIGAVEEELIKEGLPVTEIQRLCDVHFAVMKEGLSEQEAPEVPPGHPVHTYMAENKVIGALCEKLNAQVAALSQPPSDKALKEVSETLGQLAQVNVHYVRKENQLFPFLEKHGITGPPKVMWGVHDEIRGLLKQARRAVEERNTASLGDLVPKLTRAIVEMSFKEEKILFPMALSHLTEEQWAEARAGERELGYPFLEPGAECKPAAAAQERKTAGGDLTLAVGSLSVEQLEAILRTVPFDISFVDAGDTVRYYNECANRLFPRTPGVIGRKVQNCHPPKSVHMVERILTAFKAGEKDVAEFWIQTQGRFVHIRYFAVRTKAGRYLGALEVAQDITAIRTLEGEKRLLDWDQG